MSLSAALFGFGTRTHWWVQFSAIAFTSDVKRVPQVLAPAPLGRR